MGFCFMNIDKELRSAVWNKTDGVCWYCGTKCDPFSSKSNPLMFSIDHFRPGGPDDIDNLVPSCRSCNSRKRNRTLNEFRRLCAVPAECRLTDAQVKYWEECGALDREVYDDKQGYIFYFEEHGL